jgi:ribose 5-phosphate isomerase A
LPDVSTDVEREKRLAAEAAAELVEDGMAVGLGSGSTAAYFVTALAERALDIRCVATSLATEEAARAAGLAVESFAGAGALPRLDITVDGADQVAPDRWLVKGGGGAHTREKIVARAARRFVAIVSSNKLVDEIRQPIPVELLDYGLAATLARLEHVLLRDAPRTPDGGVLADWVGPFQRPAQLSELLEVTPGVVENGFFPPGIVTEVLVGRGDDVERL